VVPAADKQQAFRAYSNFVDHLKDDPDKWNPFVPAAFLEAGLRADSNFQLLDLKNIVSITRNCFDNVAYMPSLDTTYKLSTAELRSFSLAGMRWVSELESSKLAFKVQPTLVSPSWLTPFSGTLTRRSSKSARPRRAAPGCSTSSCGSPTSTCVLRPRSSASSLRLVTSSASVALGPER
jgi:hypothetical protein